MKTTLTPREIEVIELIAFGLSQKEVADRLKISPNTVDTIIKNAKEKLQVQKAAELATWYFVNHYHLTVDLSPVKRAMISLSFLTLVLVSLVGGFRPERFFRAVRGANAQVSRIYRSVRKSESNYYLMTV